VAPKNGKVVCPGIEKPASERATTLSWSLIAAAFVAVNGAVLLHGGIRIAGDAYRYLDGADRLLAGAALVGKQSSYPGYVGVVALWKAVGIGLPGVIAFQLLAAAAAAVVLYDLGRSLGGQRTGAAAALFFAANPDIARWHAYVLTDSLYISSVVAATWLVHRAAERRGAWLIAAAAGVLWTALLRPNGWLLVAVAGAYLTARLVPSRRARAGLVVAVLAVFVAASAAPPFRRGVETERPGEMLRRGQVVWGHEASRMPMPPEPSGPADRDWIHDLGYVVRHPVACARLGALRVWTELRHTRPFYSFRHNALAAAYLTPLYLLALWGGWILRREPLARLAGAVVAAHLLLVGLTFADWDGRFLLYILPLIGVFSARGLRSLLPERPAPSLR
jgi:4-amino-4-deoxy-L-arabinose transferase-like glycosyltransferase